MQFSAKLLLAIAANAIIANGDLITTEVLVQAGYTATGATVTFSPVVKTLTYTPVVVANPGGGPEASSTSLAPYVPGGAGGNGGSGSGGSGSGGSGAGGGTGGSSVSGGPPYIPTLI